MLPPVLELVLELELALALALALWQARQLASARRCWSPRVRCQCGKHCPQRCQQEARQEARQLPHGRMPYVRRPHRKGVQGGMQGGWERQHPHSEEVRTNRSLALPSAVEQLERSRA